MKYNGKRVHLYRDLKRYFPNVTRVKLQKSSLGTFLHNYPEVKLKTSYLELVFHSDLKREVPYFEVEDYYEAHYVRVFLIRDDRRTISVLKSALHGETYIGMFLYDLQEICKVKDPPAVDYICTNWLPQDFINDKNLYTEAKYGDMFVGLHKAPTKGQIPFVTVENFLEAEWAEKVYIQDAIKAIKAYKFPPPMLSINNPLTIPAARTSSVVLH